MTDFLPKSCRRCGAAIDEQSVCAAVNCPVFPSSPVAATERCDDCGAEYVSAEDLAETRHLWERVRPGDTMPSGECPRCGALCFPITKVKLAHLSLCQRCCIRWVPQMLTGYSVTNCRCDGCGTVADLALCRFEIPEPTTRAEAA